MRKVSEWGHVDEDRKDRGRIGRKRSRPASVKGSAISGVEPRAGTAGSKHKKPFVL
jgi:hypothetical protein